MSLRLSPELNLQPRKSNLKTPGEADGEALTSLSSTFSETPTTPRLGSFKGFSSGFEPLRAAGGCAVMSS